MKALATVFALAVFTSLVLSAALLTFAISTLPYVAIGSAIALLVKVRQRATTAGQLPQRYTPMAHVVPRPIPPSGWVYVPLWMGPPPQATMPVIDAEVIEDPN